MLNRLWGRRGAGDSPRREVLVSWDEPRAAAATKEDLLAQTLIPDDDLVCGFLEHD
jgi:hypothetical protein